MLRYVLSTKVFERLQGRTTPLALAAAFSLVLFAFHGTLPALASSGITHSGAVAGQAILPTRSEDEEMSDAFFFPEDVGGDDHGNADVSAATSASPMSTAMSAESADSAAVTQVSAATEMSAVSVEDEFDNAGPGNVEEMAFVEGADFSAATIATAATAEDPASVAEAVTVENPATVMDAVTVEDAATAASAATVEDAATVEEADNAGEAMMQDNSGPGENAGEGNVEPATPVSPVSAVSPVDDNAGRGENSGHGSQ